MFLLDFPEPNHAIVSRELSQFVTPVGNKSIFEGIPRKYYPYCICSFLFLCSFAYLLFYEVPVQSLDETPIRSQVIALQPAAGMMFLVFFHALFALCNFMLTEVHPFLGACGNLLHFGMIYHCNAHCLQSNTGVAKTPQKLSMAKRKLVMSGK